MRTMLVRTLGAALLLATFLVGATAGNIATAATESAIDGVWVGSVVVRAGGGQQSYPLLLNLAGVDGEVRGAALFADSLELPSVYEFVTLAAGQTKGRKTTLRVILKGGQEIELVLRLRRDALKGKASAEDGSVRGARVTLVPAMPGTLQHLWAGEFEEAGGRRVPLPFAVALDERGRGAVLLGERSGTVGNATVAGGRVVMTAVMADGDAQLDLLVDGDRLTGPVTGVANGSASAWMGGTVSSPRIARVTPATVPPGRVTEITLSGSNLSPGMVLIAEDVPDAWVAAPRILSPGRATAELFVPAEASNGDSLGLVAITGAGERVAFRKDARVGVTRTVSFAADIEPIFISRCALSGCHVQPSPNDPSYSEGAEPPAGLVLSRGTAYGNIVDVPSTERPELDRIEPGDPERSYMILKLRGAPGIVGARMPFGGPFLSDAQIQTFVEWVLAGAERN